jgi:hypothetical protein
MHIESIFLINFAGWAIAAPAQSVVLEKRQAIDVNSCWCCEIALQPHGNFYGAGTGCKTGISTPLSIELRISV